MASQSGQLKASVPSLALGERGRLVGMLFVVLTINAAGWGIFIFQIAPHHFQFKGLGIGVGVAFTAWILGARHALDADHISAIDNTTRKLMADGRRPLGTGFFFALGHSSIIMVVGVGWMKSGRRSSWRVPRSPRSWRQSNKGVSCPSATTKSPPTLIVPMQWSRLPSCSTFLFDLQAERA